MDTSPEPFVPPVVTVRGLRVVLDADAALLYQVPAEELRRQVRRQARRFPEDFMLCLSPAEGARMAGRCGGAPPRFAFFPEGIAMLAAILDSPLAVNGNVNMTRAFVYLDRLSVVGQMN
ncbi:MAG: ORF6N domain-containing protein [Elusimicrobia bacterium]|nr:ORF6N domain-containing protein [Elusimicrobiota bacterium]